jgi:protein-tyrosine phosphatase
MTTANIIKGAVMRPAKTSGGEALLQADQNQAVELPVERTPESSVHARMTASLAGPRSARSFRKRLQAVIKRLLPANVFAGLRVVAELKPVSHSRYRRLQSVLLAWKRAGQKPVFGSQVSSVVFVCHGNIMRSPTAEAMLNRELEKQGGPKLKVSSAGLHAIDGRSADPRAQTVAPEFGIAVDDHSAQLLTPTVIDSSDLVIVMDIQNAAEFLLRYPRASEKLFMLRQFSDQSRGSGKDIPDPYPGNEEDMRRCCVMLRECIEELTSDLLATPNSNTFLTGGNGK